MKLLEEIANQFSLLELENYKLEGKTRQVAETMRANGEENRQYNTRNRNPQVPVEPQRIVAIPNLNRRRYLWVSDRNRVDGYEEELD